MSKTSVPLKNRLSLKEYFSAKRISYLGVFTALSVVLYNFGSFNLPFFPPFLSIDFSLVPILLGGFMLGPLGGVIIVVCRFLLKMPLSRTFFIGESADLFLGLCFVLIASLIYKQKRDIKGALLGLGIAIPITTAFAILLNRYVLVYAYVQVLFGGNWDILLNMVRPLYADVTRETFFNYFLWAAIVPLNLLSFLSSAIITFLLYKRLQRVVDKIINSTFAKSKKSKAAMPETIISNSAEETFELGEKLSDKLSGGAIVLLTGDLGTGKTVFSKGIAKGLGLNSDITSPTFTIMNLHKLNENSSFCHIDAYRLQSESEAFETGITDHIGDNNTICVIEWFSKIESLLKGQRCIPVSIKTIDENSREITVNCERVI